MTYRAIRSPQGQVISNFGDRIVPLDGLGLGCGEDFIRSHGPQLDERALEWWSRDASIKNTEGDRNEVKSERDTPLATGDRGHLEGGATDEHDEDLTTDLYKRSFSVKLLPNAECRGRTDQGDHDEVPVLENTLKDVGPVVEPPAVDRVEDLGEDKVLNTSVVTTLLL